MSFVDKAKHKAEEIIGEVKEKVGELTGNKELETEGQSVPRGSPPGGVDPRDVLWADQVSGNVKQVGDSVKDTVSDLGRKLGKD